jgi:hypothetical protein
MPNFNERFDLILGQGRGADKPSDRDPSDRDPVMPGSPSLTPEVPAHILASLRAGDVRPRLMWDYAWELAGGIEHDPRGQRHLTDSGECFVRYRATAPCEVAVEPDEAEQRRRLGSSVVGTLEALIWDLVSPDDEDPSEMDLHDNWELSMGDWQLRPGSNGGGRPHRG